MQGQSPWGNLGLKHFAQGHNDNRTMCCTLGSNEHVILTEGDQLNLQFENNPLSASDFHPSELLSMRGALS